MCSSRAYYVYVRLLCMRLVGLVRLLMDVRFGNLAWEWLVVMSRRKKRANRRVSAGQEGTWEAWCKKGPVQLWQAPNSVGWII